MNTCVDKLDLQGCNITDVGFKGLVEVPSAPLPVMPRTVRVHLPCCRHPGARATRCAHRGGLVRAAAATRISCRRLWLAAFLMLGAWSGG